MCNLSIPPPPAHLNTFLQQRVYRSQVCTGRPEYYLCYQCLCQFSCVLGVGSEGGRVGVWQQSVWALFPAVLCNHTKNKGFPGNIRRIQVAVEFFFFFLYVQWHALTQSPSEAPQWWAAVTTTTGSKDSRWGHPDPGGYQGARGQVLLWVVRADLTHK